MNSVNHALRELLRRDVLGDAVPVSFEAPNRPWTQGAVRPSLNAFLYDVRENLVRREVMLEPVRDSSGAIVGRRPPPTRYDLYYVLSVWGCPIELEHQLLTAVVVALGGYEVLPPEMFEHPDPNAPSTFLTTASGMKRGMLPMFSGELKMQVELTVTTPVPIPVETYVAGPPVREPAHVSVLSQSPDEILARRKLALRMPRPRTAGDDPHAATRTAIAEAVAALPAPEPAKPPAPAGAQPAAGRPAGAPPGAARPAGAPPAAGRPAGAPAGAARPAGAPPGQPGARPAGQPPPGQGAQPGARPPAAAPPPLVQLRAALTQAAQAQAALAQAVASLSTMLPAGAPAKPPAAQQAQPAAAPQAGSQPAQPAQPAPAAAAQPAPAAAAKPAPDAGPAATTKPVPKASS